MIWIQENWIIAAIIAVLVIAAIAFLLRRRKADVFDFADEPENVRKPVAAPAPKPLEPKRPDIVAAEPARFKPLDPAPEPVAPPAPASTPVAAPDPAPAHADVVEPASPEPTPAVSNSAAPSGDNLRLIKGLGPKLATLLNSLGVTRFDQIAAWTDADIARIDPQLGKFQGRIIKDEWVDQASFLAKRDKAGFEAKYGALGGEL